MNKNALLRALSSSLLLTLLACGGGGDGGDEQVAARSSGTVVTGTGTGTGTSGPTGAVTTRSFAFPNFGPNSRLVIPTSFTATGETVIGAASAVNTLAREVAGPLARLSVQEEATSEGDLHPVAANPCGTATVCALSEVLEVEAPRARSTEEIRPRFQELAAGARREFYLVPGFKFVTAEKVLEPNETLHCTIFAEVDEDTDAPVLSRAKALAIAEAFDSNNPQRPGSGIYDQVRAVFGSEWTQNGGADGDSKIVLMFYSSSTLSEGLFGYTSPADANPNGGNVSNRGEIIYLNADKSNYQTMATLSHEFQHIVNQNHKVSQQGARPAGAALENTSVNEGLSGLAEEVCGFTFQSGNVLLAAISNDYLNKPERHEFFDFNQAGLGYGQGYLFFKYVREHFGDGVIRNLCTSTDTGLSNLNTHLPLGFKETFRRWTVANYATNLDGSVPSIYRYPSGFKTNGTYPAGQLVGVRTFPMNDEQANPVGGLNAWSVSYQVFDQGSGGTLQVTVNSAPGSPVAVILEQLEGTFTSFSQ